jgi:hypothetical protein
LAASVSAINLGTSATGTNPSRSGDLGSGFYTPSGSTVAVAAGGVEVQQWNTLASAVDYVSVTPGKSGTAPSIAVAGATTNQNLSLAPAGTGSVNVTTGALNIVSVSSGLQLNGTNGISYPTDNTAGGSIAIGVSALANETAAGAAAYHNTAIGYQAMGTGTMTTAALGNVALGYQALKIVTSGASNTILGGGAAAAVTSGGSNVIVGSGVAPTLANGSSNILLGTSSSTDVPASSTSNWLSINNAIFGDMGGLNFKIGGSNTLNTGAVLDLSANNNSLLLPVGTSGNRPSTGTNGMIRYNSSTPAVEGYINNTWSPLAISGSSTVNLGTSVTGTNPSRSGDLGTGLYTPSGSTVAVAAGGVEAMQWNTLSSGVDYVSVTPGKSGTAPSITVTGTDTNIGLQLVTTGAGGIGINATPSTTNPLTVGSSSSNGNGAYLAAAGVWVNASDRRIKENIRPIQYGLDAVMKLDPVAYDMKDSHEHQVGFIAQDVLKVVPEVVGVPRDPLTEHYGLSYGNMVAVTVKAIQELKADNDNLRAQVAELQGSGVRGQGLEDSAFGVGHSDSSDRIIWIMVGGFSVIILLMGGFVWHTQREMRKLRRRIKKKA